MRVTRLLGCLFVVGIVAAGVATGAQEEEVRLYTNADLEKFGPPEAPNPPPPPAARQNADGQWSFVHDHLDREYSRIATDRRLDLEETLVQPEPEPVDDGYVRYPVYGRYGLWGHGYYDPGRRGGGRSVVDDFRRYYDQRTARHGFLVPRKNAPPRPIPEPRYRAHERAHGDTRTDAARRSRTGEPVHRIAAPSRPAGPSKVRAGSGGNSRSPSRGRVSDGSSARSGGSSRGTTRGSGGSRSGQRGGGKRR